MNSLSAKRRFKASLATCSSEMLNSHAYAVGALFSSAAERMNSHKAIEYFFYFFSKQSKMQIKIIFYQILIYSVCRTAKR